MATASTKRPRRSTTTRLSHRDDKPVAQGRSTLTNAGGNKGPVDHIIPPYNVLPVIFIPGIMGSNLQQKGNPANRVWNLDGKDRPMNVATDWGPLNWTFQSKDPGYRQKVLNPAGVEVCQDGAIPDEGVNAWINSKKGMKDAGWGSVSQSSYHGFLLWLEKVLNTPNLMFENIMNPTGGVRPHFLKDDAYNIDWPVGTGTGAHVNGVPPTGSARPPFLKDYAYNGDWPVGTGTGAHVNGVPPTGAPAPLVPGSEFIDALARFHMPVYAFGYNWLESNQKAGLKLKERIEEIIKWYDNFKGNVNFHCSQVILVTHSMGGLVARSCLNNDGMQDKIAGIVHGVMPSIGAAVAYRRCKIGMLDEQPSSILNSISAGALGADGQNVTPVFAQSPGALELLPTAQYGSGWLAIDSPSGRAIGIEPKSGDPYKDIYLRSDRWWGLIREEWLRPTGGAPITREIFENNINAIVKPFHEGIRDKYHKETYIFYGNNTKNNSFQGVHWTIKDGGGGAKDKPSPEQVSGLGFDDVDDDGSNPLWVGKIVAVVDDEYTDSVNVTTSGQYQLRCALQDGGGDGTVPASSGKFPLASGGGAIKMQVGINGIEHESAYKNDTVQSFVLDSIHKIAATAKVVK